MSSRLTLLTGLAASLLLSACIGDASLAQVNGADDGVPDEFLRVDVHPSDRNTDLLPESHWVDGWWYDSDLLELDMRTPVRVQGAITTHQAMVGPLSDTSGRPVPVGASVAAWIDGSIMTASTTSDTATGVYTLDLPPQQGWAIAVVPEDGSTIPFSVITDQDIEHDRPDWDLQLDNGSMVRGVITDPHGEPVSDMLVRAVHSQTGVAGPTVRTRASGQYTIHLEPDVYTLEFAGQAGETIPTTSVEIEADNDETQWVDLAMGSLETILATGRVVDAQSNRPIDGVTLRFWSRGLADHDNASLELETTTDPAGAYSVELLPGQWRMELVAQTEQQLSPVADSFTVGPDTDAVDFGVTTMEPYTTVQAIVRDPGGEPAAGITVVITEQAISERTFTATTDMAGAFTLAVPTTDLHVVLTPGDASAAVTHLDIHGESFPHSLELALGRLLTGRVVHNDSPVQAALVEVRDGATERLYATTITDLEGYFEIRLATDADVLPPNDSLDDDTGYWDTGYLD